MYNKYKALHECNRKETIMCDDEIYITDKEEEKQKELEKQALENTPIRKNSTR